MNRATVKKEEVEGNTNIILVGPLFNMWPPFKHQMKHHVFFEFHIVAQHRLTTHATQNNFFGAQITTFATVVHTNWSASQRNFAPSRNGAQGMDNKKIAETLDATCTMLLSVHRTSTGKQAHVHKVATEASFGFKN